MTVTPPSSPETQLQKSRAAETFSVDFDGIQQAFSSSQDGGVGDGGAFNGVRSMASVGAAALAPLVLGAAEASAKGGEFGIIEGKSASFFHPIIMVSERKRQNKYCCTSWCKYQGASKASVIGSDGRQPARCLFCFYEGVAF